MEGSHRAQDLLACMVPHRWLRLCARNRDGRRPSGLNAAGHRYDISRLESTPAYENRFRPGGGFHSLRARIIPRKMGVVKMFAVIKILTGTLIVALAGVGCLSLVL